MDGVIRSEFSGSLHSWLRFSACAIAVLLTVARVSASPVGSIAGSVKDPSGAVVPNAKLTLINLATGAKLEAASDANGAFQFQQLAPAVYSLSVEAQGFKKTTADSVLVEVDQITHLDVALQVGSIAETVQVTEVNTLLESDKSTLSN
jgi:hypothetical protein